MKRILLVAAALLVLTATAPRTAVAFGVKDVIAMSQYGIPDSLIIVKIRHSGTQFNLDARDMLELKAAKVSDDVVVAMLRTEDGNHAGVYYDGYYWPYDRPFAPRWYVGLDLGYYRPYHYGHGYGGYGYRGYGHGGFGYRGYGHGRR